MQGSLSSMGTLICIAVVSFAVLAQPAVAQRANTFTYPAQVLQGDGSQTCLSEESRERVRNEVKMLHKDCFESHTQKASVVDLDGDV